MRQSTLYYVADPMCSWCWGFTPVLQTIVNTLPGDVYVRYVMGGLARDSDEPMPEETRAYVQNAWRAVAERTGAEFNRDFWTKCLPRRSTYPACRAVLAAADQAPDAGPVMFHVIQHAYYLEARNPSDLDTLIQLSGEIGLNANRFARAITSPEIEQRLQEDFALRRSLHANQFPSLILDHMGDESWIACGYEDEEVALELIHTTLMS